MVFNMNMVGCSNARGDVIDTFIYCKEYVNFETDCYILALAMKYFNLASIETLEDQVIPPSIGQTAAGEKREWLYGHLKTMVSQYITNVQEEAVETIQEEVATVDMPPVREEYHWREHNCEKIYKYTNARKNHEEKVHGLVIEDETSLPHDTDMKEDKKVDDVFTYATARLNLGLLIRCADDAVREGDGDCIILCWRFFLVYFKAFSHHKYAIAAFLLLANVTALLTERKSHLLTWNRTINNKGCKGKNMSCDVRLEQCNCPAKQLISHLGVNLNEKCAKREEGAIAFLEEMLVMIDEDICVVRLSGKHTVQKKEDTKLQVSEFVKNKIFTSTPGRKYAHFKDFSCNMLSRMDITVFSNWLKEQMKKLMKKYP